MNKYIANIVFGIWFLVSFYVLASIFRRNWTIHVVECCILILPTLLLARGDSFFLKARISGIAGISFMGSLFFVGNPNGGDGMEILLPMFLAPAYLFIVAVVCLICGVFANLVMKYEIIQKNRKRIQTFKGEWVFIVFIIILGGILTKHEDFKVFLPLRKPLNVPKYEIIEMGKTKKYFTVLYENGFGYHSDKKPTVEEIEDLYKERVELVPKTPALLKQYKGSYFYGIDKDISLLTIYSERIGRVILLLGYPVYLFTMFLFYIVNRRWYYQKIQNYS